MGVLVLFMLFLGNLTLMSIIGLMLISIKSTRENMLKDYRDSIRQHRVVSLARRNSRGN